MTISWLLLYFYLIHQVENAEGSRSSKQSIEYYKLIEEEKQVTNSNGNETYNWEYGEYGPCSVTCGTGKHKSMKHYL